MNNTWNIDSIQAVTEDKAKELATDTKEYKGHTLYLVNFGGYFGRSVLVFRNGNHIYYANDYELHHDWWVKENPDGNLYDYMVEGITNKLFADTDYDTIEDYNDYDRKSYYLHNYYAMQTEHESIFAICPSEEDKAAFKTKTETWTYDPVGFCYVPNGEFVARHIELMNTLNKAKADKANDYDYYYKAFIYEMYNHEYIINWEADHDTLSAFGNVGWHDNDLNAYFDELEFTETQRKAYMDARRYVLTKENYDEELGCVV